jgi:solute carrier family 29 (equilibrative nucleoside transporter), member 1/2/3
MFGVFAVTLSVFPAVTSSILSVHEEGSGGPTWSQAAVFLPIGFMVFAVGDWTGRILPQSKFLTFTDWRALAVASAARIVFIVSRGCCNGNLL